MTINPIDDYQRGFRDGQEARKRDDAYRDYERGFRDGYGSPQPWRFVPYEYYLSYPSQPWWGGPTVTLMGATSG